jgi:hypothetical protein
MNYELSIQDELIEVEDKFITEISYQEQPILANYCALTLDEISPKCVTALSKAQTWMETLFLSQRRRMSPLRSFVATSG